MIVVDVETTGLDPNKHSIASIGAIDFNNPKNQFYEECKIWDGAEITMEALKINGFTLEQIKDVNKKSLKQILEEFLNWANNIEILTLAGHNIPFDHSFLQISANKFGLRWNFGKRCVDLHSICYTNYLQKGINLPKKDRRSDINLDTVLIYVGLLPEPKPHNGLIGAKMEAEAFSRLIHSKSLLQEFSQYKIPEYLSR